MEFQAENAPAVEEEVLAERDTALADLFQDAKRFEVASVGLAEAERKLIEEKTGRKLAEEKIEVIRALDAKDGLLGYAVITNEIGKFQPITFMVAVDPNAAIRDIIVMVYRESHGGDVRRRRFLKQFCGKDLDDALKVSRDIINVSGATLSAHAITRGAKKVLWQARVSVFDEKRRAGLTWQPLAREEKKTAVHRSARVRMGTVLEAVVFGDGTNEMFAEVDRLERLLSIYIPESDISRANREASSRPVEVADETIACVAAALHYAERTGGAFDPTMRPHGFREVRIDRAARTIRYESDLSLDLGAIGKGYALDRAARVLRTHGVRSALLNFGGQLLVLDPPERAPHWVIGVRDPANETTVAGFFACANVSLSTSGCYERGAHILGARGGSATVAHRSAAAADALSTALLVRGRDAVDSIARFGGAALYIDDERQSISSRAFVPYRSLPRIPRTLG